MRKSPSFRVNREAGFTLTEILVMILIVGILAAVAIPSLILQRERATDVAAKTRASSAERAMVIYEQDNDTFACGDDAACHSAVRRIDPSLDAPDLRFSSSGGDTGDPTKHGYRVTTRAGQLRTYYVDQPPGAAVEHGCDLNGSAHHGGCRVAGGASSGSW